MKTACRLLPFCCCFFFSVLPGFAYRGINNSLPDILRHSNGFSHKVPVLSITCPGDITISVDSTACTASFDYLIEYSDGDLLQTAGLPSGAFPVGQTLNSFTLTDSLGNVTGCSFLVTVVDQIKPSCRAPKDTVVTCGNFDPALASYGVAWAQDNCCLDTLTTRTNTAQFDTLCTSGTIYRLFQALDCNGNSSLCSQKISVQNVQQYYIRFPDDLITTDCRAANGYGVPVVFGADCGLVQISFEDAQIDLVPDACYRIERVWSIINGCHYNPALPLTYIPNPNPSALQNNANNLPGPVVSACNAAAPWAPTVVKIQPGDTAATNYCTFWNTNANGYYYKQYIKIVDNTGPRLVDCPSAAVILPDTTQNDPALWNNVFDPNTPAVDLTETETALTMTATDSCSGSSVRLDFQLFLDLDGNGAVETLISSSQLGSIPNGLGWNKVMYGNVSGSPTPTSFDNRPVPDDQKWGFAKQETSTGLSRTASVAFNTSGAPNAFVRPQLPEGTHKIRWLVSDGCGNLSVCEYPFTVQKGITPVVEFPGENSFALYQNQPNPFDHSTTIEFRLQEAAEAILTVYDVRGRLLYSQNGNFESGLNRLVIEGEWLDQGLLFYKLESNGNTAWRRMLRLR